MHAVGFAELIGRLEPPGGSARSESAATSLFGVERERVQGGLAGVGGACQLAGALRVGQRDDELNGQVTAGEVVQGMNRRLQLGLFGEGLVELLAQPACEPAL